VVRQFLIVVRDQILMMTRSKFAISINREQLAMKYCHAPVNRQFLQNALATQKGIDIAK
jgi:hypothetical protein